MKLKSSLYNMLIPIFLLQGIGAFSQHTTCSTTLPPGTPTPTPSSCDISSETVKCVKLKLHWINNTNDPNATDPNSNQEYNHLIDLINEFYRPGKIHFFLSDDCANRVFVGPSITNQSPFYNLLDPDGNGTLEGLDYEYDAINVYFVADSWANRNSRAGFGYNYLTVGDQAPLSTIAHEIGHALDLIHPFEWDPGDPAECKDGTGCDLYNDLVCDTGPDPYAQDLDEDGIPDKDKWIVNCRHNIPNSIADDCGDVVTPWNIPFDNIMGEYPCRSRFTECQFARMHNFLNNEYTHWIGDCNDAFDPYCGDIIIDSYTLWENQTREICPGQRIIITASGTLHLKNTTITKKNVAPHPNCPDLKSPGPWEGIYLTGGIANHQSTGVGGNTTIGPIGALISESGSVIEHSKNGIQALNNFGAIWLSGTTMNDNGQMINVNHDASIGGVNTTKVSPGSLGLVKIQSCQLSADADHEFLQNVQINTIGTSCYIKDSDISLNGMASNIVAINSAKGLLHISNATTIEDFDKAIVKGADGSAANSFKGLRMANSEILNSTRAISNESSLVNVSFNLIEGRVTSNNESMGLWKGNNFKGRVILNNPNLSQLVEENYFNENEIEMNKSNDKSFLFCNQFLKPQQNDISVYAGDATLLPISWGNEANSSGNKYTITKSEMWGSIFGADVVHFHYELDPQTVFEYVGMSNQNASAPRSCNYDLYPEGLNPGGGDPDEDDLIVLEGEYQLLQGLIDSLDTVINGGGNDIQVSEQLVEEYEGLQLDIVRQALMSSEWDSTLENQHSIWLSRFNSDQYYILGGEVMQYLANADLTGLNSYLSTLVVTSESSADYNNFSNGILFLENMQNAGISIFELTEVEANNLEIYATSTWGNYSKHLRSFLNQYYGRIYLKEDFISSSMQSGSLPIPIEEVHEFNVHDEESWFVPNPATDQLFLQNVGLEETVMFYSSTGQVVLSEDAADVIDISLIVPGVYIIQIVNKDGQVRKRDKIIVN